MSAYYLKLVPDQLRCSFEGEQLNEVVAYLEDHIVAMEINVKHSDEIMFIDCGGELEEIRCPHCQKEISWDWWGEKMQKAYDDHFSDLSVKLPCCKEVSSLDQLEYTMLCCFSNCAFEILYPKSELTKEDIEVI